MCLDTFVNIRPFQWLFWSGMAAGIAMLVYFLSHYCMPEVVSFFKGIRPFMRKSMLEHRQFMEKRKRERV